jgi:hypothetical protein
MSPYAANIPGRKVLTLPGNLKTLVLSRLHDFSDCCVSNKVKVVVVYTVMMYGKAEI